MCTGKTGVGSWVFYGMNQLNIGECSAYLDVDTSGCGFTSAYNYFTTINGPGNHYGTIGANAIYLPTSTGFRVYV
jgi:hypothetical protein